MVEIEYVSGSIESLASQATLQLDLVEHCCDLIHHHIHRSEVENRLRERSIAVAEVKVPFNILETTKTY